MAAGEPGEKIATEQETVSHTISAAPWKAIWLMRGNCPTNAAARAGNNYHTPINLITHTTMNIPLRAQRTFLLYLTHHFLLQRQPNTRTLHHIDLLQVQHVT